MRSRDIERLRRLSDLRVALELRNLAPLDAKTRRLEAEVKTLDALEHVPAAATDDVLLNLNYQAWQEKRRQALLIEIAIAREARKPISAAVAREKARSSVLEAIGDRHMRMRYQILKRSENDALIDI